MSRRHHCCLLLVCALLLSTASACGTLVSKAEMRQFGQPFSGVQLDAGVAGCLWSAAMNPETKPPGLGNVAYFFTFIGPMADLPLSFLADLLLVPLDGALGGGKLQTTILSTPAILPQCGSGQIPPHGGMPDEPK